MADSSPTTNGLLPDKMRAVIIREPGGPEVLVPAKLSTPRAAAGEVLIRVVAAGVNRPDTLQRMGLYPAPPDAPDWPGLEVSGTVAEVGAGVNGYVGGEQVVALLNGGGYAEYATAHEGSVLPLPVGMDPVKAAGLPEALFTVWYNVFDRAALAPGETLLVHGGTSGIGTTAIQLAVARGHRVFTTAGSDEKCARCLELGAELAVNYNDADFAEEVNNATDRRGVNVILDMVGGDYVQRNLACLAESGRVSMIAFLRGSRIEVDLLRLMLKRQVLTGSTLRVRSSEEKAGIAGALADEVWPLLESNAVAPVVDSVFPLDEAAAAHAHMEKGLHVGKILLSTEA